MSHEPRRTAARLRAEDDMTAEKFMLLVPVIGAVIPLDVGPVWELVTAVS